MDRTTSLALRGIDAAGDSSVLFRFAAGGRTFSWRFNAGTFDELVALGLGGRLGKGRDVHFDAARVSFTEGTELTPGKVRIAIGRKVRVVAPMPAEKQVIKRRRKPRTKAAEKQPQAAPKTPIA